jgi:hypothetical protein
MAWDSTYLSEVISEVAVNEQWENERLVTYPSRPKQSWQRNSHGTHVLHVHVTCTASIFDNYISVYLSVHRLQ